MADVSSFTIDDTVRLTFVTKDAGVLFDPASIEVKIGMPINASLPAGSNREVTTYVQTDPEIVQESTGIYHVDVAADRLGEWEFEIRIIDSGITTTYPKGRFVIVPRTLG